MKTKKMLFLIATFVVIFVIKMPVVAFDAEPKCEMVDSEEAAESIAQTDSIDIANHDEDDNDVTTEETEVLESQKELITRINKKPFSPNGQGTVVDLAYEGDGKMFYTFETPEGNVFYLIIDRQRDRDNVYFLNAVTEQDLLALVEGLETTNPISISTIPDPVVSSTPIKTELEDDSSVTSPPVSEITHDNKNSNSGMVVFVLIGAVAFGAIAYYFKIYKPKQNEFDDEDDEYSYEDDENDEIEFEDEDDTDETDNFDATYEDSEDY